MEHARAFLARLETGIFGRLRRDAAAEWAAYTQHRFVRGLADGTLPETDFRRYLKQDYLYLHHYARAHALALLKCEDVAQMRDFAAVITAILHEMQLHQSYCAEWGITAEDLAREPESLELLAYSRFLIDVGVSGDVLDLLAALAACAVGYGEIGARLLADPATLRAGNPYFRWIEAYGGEAYCTLALASLDRLETAWCAYASESRYPGLLKKFRIATRLEAEFWQAGRFTRGSS